MIEQCQDQKERSKSTLHLYGCIHISVPTIDQLTTPPPQPLDVIPSLPIKTITVKDVQAADSKAALQAEFTE